MLHSKPNKERADSLGCDINVSMAYGRAVNVLGIKKRKGNISDRYCASAS
jgi:hypothetical protein